jgi:hypothetical protein
MDKLTKAFALLTLKGQGPKPKAALVAEKADTKIDKLIDLFEFFWSGRPRGTRN